jgi:hypothetical protein
MKRIKKLLLFLAISLLVIGVAVPGSAGQRKFRHVSGDWTMDETVDVLEARGEYTIPEGCDPAEDEDCIVVLGDYLQFSKMTGDIIANHLFMQSTYIHPDKPMELLGVVRLHGEAFGKEIDAWGKLTFDMFPNEDLTEIEMTGIGRYMFPFRDCSPRVFVRYQGTYYPGRGWAEGTYNGVITGSCR